MLPEVGDNQNVASQGGSLDDLFKVIISTSVKICTCNNTGNGNEKPSVVSLLFF